MGLRWSVPLPGPFTVSGRVGLPRIARGRRPVTTPASRREPSNAELREQAARNMVRALSNHQAELLWQLVFAATHPQLSDDQLAAEYLERREEEAEKLRQVCTALAKDKRLRLVKPWPGCIDGNLCSLEPKPPSKRERRAAHRQFKQWLSEP